MMKLATCLLNISEARNKQVIRHILHQTKTTIEQECPVGATILNTFCDTDYNRSVISISGQLPQLEQAVTSAVTAALHTIDLRHHEGGHPRLGAVDLIPLHPISEDTTLADCDTLADNIAHNIINNVPGSSFFKFSREPGQGLIERRRSSGWFQSKIAPDFLPDLGVYNDRLGVTGLGASPYMSNYNISLETRDMKVARQVVEVIREKSGGLPGVSAMAFHHKDNIEIACNVDMFILKENNSMHMKHLKMNNIERVMGELWRTRFSVIGDQVETQASRSGTSVTGDSVIIGFTPEQSRSLTLQALASNISCSASLK